MKTSHIQIEGITCANCATHIEKMLEAVPGVERVEVSLEDGAAVEHKDVAEQELLRAVAAAGYKGHIRGR